MGEMSVSQRVRRLRPSVTVAVASRAKQMIREGHDVIGFTLGEPDFDTPEFIKDAAIEALRSGQTKYMPTLGDPETREAVARKLREENGIPVQAEHVGVSAGAKQALYVLFQCLLDHPEPGQPPAEVLMPTPTWVSYEPHVELAGGRVVHLPTTPRSRFRISPDRLRDAISPRTRAIVFCSPSNPCGTMYDEAALREIAGVVAEAAAGVAPELVVVVDEIYEKIVFGGRRHFSIGSIPEIADRVVTINGLSKAYAMTGWRAGYFACPGTFGARLIEAMGTLQGQISTNITSFVYPAIRAALADGGPDTERMRAAFEARAACVAARLREMPGLTFHEPEGAIYAFPDISAHFGRRSARGHEITSSLTFCEALLAEELVALVPGEDFGPPGERHVRISIAASEAQIDAGMDRVARFVAGLR